MNVIWPWLGFNLFVVVLLALDLGILHRKDSEITVPHALLLSLLYIIMALIFAGGMFLISGQQAGYEFLTGYLIEKSLSIDNIFVFVLIFTHFQVPSRYQYRVLFWGILGALFMRGILIFTGVSVINAFHWIIYVFGAFLVITGIRMLVAVDQEPDIEKNRVVGFMRRHFRVTEDFVGSRFIVKRDGVRFITPLLIVLILVELTDVVFALDSIPAIFAITTDPFIVYTSNVFAILGLRALYFALAAVIHRFHYLKYGLSLVLVVVGLKMIVNTWYDSKVIPTEIALLVTLLLIGGSILFSMWKTRGVPAVETSRLASRWWIPGTPAKRHRSSDEPH